MGFSGKKVKLLTISSRTFLVTGTSKMIKTVMLSCGVYDGTDMHVSTIII